MSASPPEHDPPEAAASSSAAAAAANATAGPAHEPLACVSCRSRKLKCDRQKPVCARCAKAGAECVYPESRRKPAFKRRNVRELEERLAQVEGLLRTVGKHRASQSAQSDEARTEESSPGALGGEPLRPDRFRASPLEGPMPWFPLSPTDSPAGVGDTAQHGELLGLGQFESLPPFEMIEDLHGIFFENQRNFMPIVQPASYLKSFHSPPHMRPPMCLQYAIWTVASNGHPKYGCYHDALYRRARQYLEADELKGHGEHFISIRHAQAWILVAVDEARCLLFTRASMSSARSVRLSGMMGLHLLDGDLPEEELPKAPMIAPPKSWVEVEERRRVFWGGFCIDSYASISTGWPTLIDLNQVTSHLPASEEAFISGIEESSPTLQEVFRGAPYSTFAGNIVLCHVFNQMMKHAHRPMPDDRPEDPDYGPFWKRHRELDNMLSSAFMFLPERLRLPQNLRDSIAVQANLNLHAAVICLHNAAREKADKFKLPGLRQSSRTRALTAAQEIIDIIKATSHVKGGLRGPLMALSLYCAGSAFIFQAKEEPQNFDKGNLHLLIDCMIAIGHQHVITHAYLKQLLLDIERNGVSHLMDPLPAFHFPQSTVNHGVPLVARASTSRHTRMQPPLPGRLPLGEPMGSISSFTGSSAIPCDMFVGSYAPSEEPEGPANKRMRTSARPGSGLLGGKAKAPSFTGAPGPSSWSAREGAQAPGGERVATGVFGYPGATGWSGAGRPMATTLPHRTGSPAMANPRATPATAPPAVPNLYAFSFPGAAAASIASASGSASGSASASASATARAFSQQSGLAPGPGPSATGFQASGSAFDLDSANNTTSTDTATSSTADTINPTFGDLNVFENLGEWGVTDAESFFSMLMDPPQDGDGDGMDPWAAHLGGAGGSGSGSGSGAGPSS